MRRHAGSGRLTVKYVSGVHRANATPAWARARVASVEGGPLRCSEGQWSQPPHCGVWHQNLKIDVGNIQVIPNISAVQRHWDTHLCDESWWSPSSMSRWVVSRASLRSSFLISVCLCRAGKHALEALPGPGLLWILDTETAPSASWRGVGEWCVVRRIR